MERKDTGNWDHTVDLLIVGSGAGAMTAALAGYDGGGDTLLIEKSDRYGGSSAMSGGGFWVPNNHLMAGVGIEDNPEDAWTYLRETTARRGLRGPLARLPGEGAGDGQVPERAHPRRVRRPARVRGLLPESSGQQARRPLPSSRRTSTPASSVTSS